MSRRNSANDPESQPISMAELMARAKEHGHDTADRIAHSGRRHGGGKDAVSVAELTGEIPKIRAEEPAQAPTEQAPPEQAPTEQASGAGVQNRPAGSGAVGAPPATRDISADAIAKRSGSAASSSSSTQAYSQDADTRGPDPLSSLSADEREREFERYRNFEDVDHHDQPARKRGLFGRRRRKDPDEAGSAGAAADVVSDTAAAEESDPPTAGIATSHTDAIHSPVAHEAAPDPDPATGPLRLHEGWRRPSGPVGPPKSSTPTPPSATGRFPVSDDRPLTGGGTFPAASPTADRFPTSTDRPSTGAGTFPSSASGTPVIDDGASTTGPIKGGATGMAPTPSGGWPTAADTADDVEDVDDDTATTDSEQETGHAGTAAAAVGAGAGLAGLSAGRRRRRAGADGTSAGSETDVSDATAVPTPALGRNGVNEPAAGKSAQAGLTWPALLGEAVLGLAVGVGLFWGFTELWKWNTYFALVLTVVVVLALVSLVYVLRKTTDLVSILLALAAGLIVTVGPLAILGEWPT